jgi:hypothetical protein
VAAAIPLEVVDTQVAAVIPEAAVAAEHQLPRSIALPHNTQHPFNMHQRSIVLLPHNTQRPCNMLVPSITVVAKDKFITVVKATTMVVSSIMVAA